jgi:hypothetical protein
MRFKWRSLVTHYMSAESPLPWLEAPPGVLAVAHDHRDIVMISGVDPYAWKGIADIVKPEVRLDRSSGCLR